MITRHHTRALLLALGVLATMIVGPAVPASAAPGDGQRPIVLDRGHIDLFELTYDQAAGQLVLQVKDDTGLYDPDIAFREPEDVTIAVDTALSEYTFGPDDLPPGYEFIPRNQPIYLLEQSQQAGLPWPGWSTERLLGSLPDGVTIPYDWGSVEFAVDVEGPGDVVTFQIGPDGTPANRYIDTTDEEPDVIETGSSTHYHTAWLFTEPGDYELTVTPWAHPSFPSKSDPLTGPAHSYHFHVGPRPAPEYGEDDFSYTVSDGQATVTGGPCEGGALVIPDTLGGAPVTAIDGDGWGVFSGCDLTSVTFPDTVTIIGADAFNTNRLTSVTLPASLTTIGYRAFWQNRLTSVVIPDSVTSIEAQAFALNWDLASVDLGDSVSSIGDYAFGFAPLTSLTIPASATSIGTGAFDWITSGVVVRFEGDAPSTDESFPEGQPVCHLSGATGFDVAPFGTRYPVSVCAGADAPLSQAIIATLDADAGSLAISVDPDDRDVVLPPFVLGPGGDRWETGGELRPVTVIDTRSGQAGWVASAQVSDFESAMSSLGAAHLGWTPTVLSADDGLSVAPGEPVAGLLDGGPGLGGPAQLGSAASGASRGTARLGADLHLAAPTDLDAGEYTALLTLTIV